MISLRMGLTSGIATSNGSSKPMEIKLQVMHRKGFSLLGWFRESSMAPMCQADLTLWHFECKKRLQIYSAKVGTDHQQSCCSLKVGSMSLWLIIFSYFFQQDSQASLDKNHYLSPRQLWVCRTQGCKKLWLQPLGAKMPIFQGPRVFKGKSTPDLPRDQKSRTSQATMCS